MWAMNLFLYNKTAHMNIKHFKSWPFIVTIGFYFLSLLFVWPFGEYSINDDWDFFLNTRFFLNGIYQKSSFTDAEFILQGLIGAAWARIFGLSFLNLRILTIIFFIGFLFGIFKILKALNKTDGIVALVLLTTAFNPLLYNSSLTFMTEIYFLTFCIWSLYFFIKFMLQKNHNTLLYAGILGSASLLIRQFGLVLLPVYLNALYLNGTKTLKFNSLIRLITPFAIAIIISSTWPQSGNMVLPEKIMNSDRSGVISTIRLFPYILTYTGFFLSPFIITHWATLNKKTLLILLLGALISFIPVYNADIFPIGNVFYIEELYGKSNFVHYIHIFDNIPFKLFLSFYASMMSFGLLHMLSSLFKNTTRPALTILLCSLGMLGMVIAVALATAEFYDRYLINFFALSILFVGIKTPKLTAKQYYIGFGGLIILPVITILLTTDYYRKLDIKWELAKQMQIERNLVTNIFVDGTFTRFMHTNRFNHPSQIDEKVPGALAYECFVHHYIVEGEGNFLYKVLHRFENSRTINKYITNPRIFGNTTVPGVEPVSQHRDDIFIKKEYFSPIYSILGKNPVVGVYCNNP